jgi:hypothetical protein
VQLVLVGAAVVLAVSAAVVARTLQSRPSEVAAGVPRS